MAIEGSITLNEIGIYEINADPRASGIEAPIGSIASMDDGSGLFLKIGAADVDWKIIPNRLKNIIHVSSQGGDFTSIKDAVDSISDNSSTNQYVIKVSPGVFVEDTITMKPFVWVQGSEQDQTVIQVNATNKDIIIGSINSGISRCLLEGATDSGKSAVYFAPLAGTTRDSFFVEDVRLGNNDTLVTVDGTGAPAAVFMENCKYGGNHQFNHGFTALAAGRVVIRNTTSTGLSTPFPDCVFRADGVGSEIVLSGVQCRSGGLTTGNAIHLSDGARLRATSANIKGFGKGLYLENTGAASTIDAVGFLMEDNTVDIHIEHPSADGTFNGSADHNKIVVDPASGFSFVISCNSLPNDGTGQVVVGTILQGDRYDRLANLSKIAREATTLGVVDGGLITVNSGLDVDVTSGNGFLKDPTFLFVKEINWNADTITIPANSVRYIYVDTNAVIQQSASMPSIETSILLGRVVSSSSTIKFIEETEVDMKHIGNKLEAIFRQALGPVFASGGLAVENGTRQLDVTPGSYFYGVNILSLAGGTPISWISLYRDGIGGWTEGSESTVSNTQYDNGSGTLQNLTAGYYAKHTLYAVGDSGSDTYFLVYSQDEYPSIAEATLAPLPLVPGYMSDAVTRIAGVIVRQGQTNIQDILDIRPRIGFSAPASSTPSDHGNLTGLLDDDHPQYLLINGTRAMTGNLNMGSQNIINANSLAVGLATAASKIHVDAGTGTASSLRFTAGTTTGQTAGDGFTVGISSTGVGEIRQYENLDTLFYTNNTIAGRFDNSQRFIVGATASQASSSGEESRIQLHGTTAPTSQLAIMRWSADTASGVMRFTKSRGASVGTHAAVVAGDFLGSASYRGSDGTNFITGATISAIVDGTVTTNGMPTRLSFAVTPTGGSSAVEAFRIDSAGRFILSPLGSPAVDVTGAGFFPAFQILGNTPVTAQMLTASYSADANPAVQNFLKSRNATIGSHTIVQNGDEIGRVQFRASDGTNFELAASIRAFVDGTPGADDMPGSLVFYTTPDGSATTVERVRINNAGLVGIGNITPTRQLDVAQTVRFRGGSPSRGKSLTTPDTTGNADWEDTRDINRAVHIHDDFTSQYDGAAGVLMPLGWAVVLNGGLVTAPVATNVTATHRGIIEINANDNGDDPLIHLGTDDMLIGDGLIKIQWLVRSPNALPTAGENWIARIGLGDDISSTSNDFVDGCYFEFGPNGTTTITTKTASNSTRTSNSSGVTLAVDTWYLLEMDITSTSVEFRINGNLVQTHVANIPTGAGRFCGPIAKLSKTAGGGDRILSIDAFRYSQFFDSNRY